MNQEKTSAATKFYKRGRQIRPLQQVQSNTSVEPGYSPSVDQEVYETMPPVLSSDQIYPQADDVDQAGDDTLNRLPPQMRPYVKRWKNMA